MKIDVWSALQQNSTWRGLFALATALGIVIRPEYQEYITAAGLAIIGIINVWRDEHKGTIVQAKTAVINSDATITTTPKG